MDEKEMREKARQMTDDQLKEELMKGWTEDVDWHWLNQVRFELFERWDKQNGTT